MNTEESEQDLERRLQELEVSTRPTKAHPVTTQTPTSSNAVAGLNQITGLFKSLPKAGKLVVVGVGIIVGFAILKSLWSLVAALFSLAFLGLGVYLAYQFLVARSQNIEK